MATKPKRNKLSSKTKKKLTGLPPKKQAYAVGRLLGKSKRKAALDAGYSSAMAEKASTKIETPDVTDALCDALDSLIGLPKAAKRIAEGIDAKRTEFAKFKGDISDHKDVIDFEQRRKYTELYLKVKGVRGISPGVEIEDDGQKKKIMVVIDC